MGGTGRDQRCATNPAGDNDAGRRALGGLGRAPRLGPQRLRRATLWRQAHRYAHADPRIAHRYTEAHQPEKDQKEMTFDFAALPPEVNSTRMYTGPGAGPMMAAAAAWNNLAG